MSEPARYDVLVVGAGPAGSVCAAHLARHGRRVLLLDRARFPRDKVCGDCLNPSVWPVIDRLELGPRLLALPHVVVREVVYRGMGGVAVRVPLPATPRGEIVVKRRDFDALLVARARELGAEFRDGVAVTKLREGGEVVTDDGAFFASVLVAADGRNSTIGRLAGLLPPSPRERVAVQCHAPRPDDHGEAVGMMFYAGGYGGTAAVGSDEINVCFVASPDEAGAVRYRASRFFHLPETTHWRTIAPLARPPARTVARDALYLVGDAARVVEPFTGEGIYYAMRSGELAAEAILAENPAAYRAAHRRMYRGRLWINRLASFAGKNPRLASLALRCFQFWPAPLARLTARVVAAQT